LNFSPLGASRVPDVDVYLLSLPLLLLRICSLSTEFFIFPTDDDASGA
jgi:hypothetical protein